MSDFNTFEKLSQDVKKYIELQIAYYKIDSLEKSAQAGSFIILAVIGVVLAIFFIIFANLFVAILLAYLFGSWVIGFGIFACLYLLMLFVVLLFSKSLHRFITNRFLAALADTLPKNID